MVESSGGVSAGGRLVEQGQEFDAGRKLRSVMTAMARRQGCETGEDSGDQLLEEGSSVLRWARWKKFLLSGFYRKVMLFKLGGIQELTKPAMDVGRNEARRIVKLAEKFVLAEGSGEDSGRLFFKERDGCLAGCVVEDEVGEVLRSMHDMHGHFAQGITAGRIFGRFYWPTRNADVARWTATCDSCQRVSPIRKSGDIRPILQLQPNDMWGIDYIGPITPSCETTGSRYILIIVDYFSRFLFARPVPEATMQSTMDVILNHVTPVLGWPRSIYSDNGSHFTGKEIKDMFTRFGVTHFPAAISHPSAVGLAERYVQMITGRIRLRCIDCKTAIHWGLLVREAVIDINTRCIRIHGYTPAEILLGYNPKRTQAAIPGGDAQTWLKEGMLPDDVLCSTEQGIGTYIDRRDEAGASMLERLAANHHAKELAVKSPGGAYKRPKTGDLVLLRDLARDKQLGRKLDPRWTEPRIIERLSKNGMSAYIRGIHEAPDRVKRYHIDDLRVYSTRTPIDTTVTSQPTINHTTMVSYSRDAFGNCPGTFVNGQRAFDFTDIG